MRKAKMIKIDDREITVRELKVKEIRQLIASENNSGFNDLLPMVCDLPPDDIDEMAPSEIRQVVEAVKEVNADFLDYLEKAGLVEVLKGSILKSLTAAFPG